VNIADRAGGFARERDLHGGQADDVPAVVAEKMRMFGAVSVLGPQALEPPNMVPQIDASRQPAFHQIIQVSVDSSAIEAEWYEFGRQIRMAHGRFGRLQPTQNLQPRHRGPKAGFSQDRL